MRSSAVDTAKKKLEETGTGQYRVTDPPWKRQVTKVAAARERRVVQQPVGKEGTHPQQQRENTVLPRAEELANGVRPRQEEAAL